MSRDPSGRRMVVRLTQGMMIAPAGLRPQWVERTH